MQYVVELERARAAAVEHARAEAQRAEAALEKLAAAERNAANYERQLREHAHEIEALRAQRDALAAERDGARKIAEDGLVVGLREGLLGDAEEACPPWLTVEEFCTKYGLPLPEGFGEDPAAESEVERARR